MITAARLQSFIDLATFLLDERCISASEQSFLIDTRRWARERPTSFHLSYRQRMWFETIVDDHRDAIEAAGLVADLDLSTQHSPEPHRDV